MAMINICLIDSILLDPWVQKYEICYFLGRDYEF